MMLDFSDPAPLALSRRIARKELRLLMRPRGQYIEKGMKLPNSVAKRLRLVKDGFPGELKMGIPFVKDGKVTIEYFHLNLHVGSVSFDDTGEAKEDWFRTMVEAKNPGTDPQAKP